MRGICLFLLLPAVASLAADSLTTEQRKLEMDSFDHVWRTVKENHWDPRMNGVDWSAVREELRPKAASAKSRDEARRTIVEMLKRLKQSHFAILPSDVYRETEEGLRAGGGERRPGQASTGIDVRVVDGAALVTSVDPESGAERAGVHTGWQVVAVDGDDVSGAIARLREAYADSTAGDLVLVRALRARLGGNEGDRVKVEFRDGAGGKVEKEIALGPPRGKLARFGLLPPLPVWFEARKLDGNAGYIAFNWFLDPARVMAGFSDAVASFADTDGLVIDLRGNAGGIGVMAMGMAGFFLDRPDLQLGTMYMRGSPLKFFVNPRAPYYAKPLAILVDGGSASTSEIFAGGMQDLKRARIFGTRTAGAALPSVIERLPNGDGFQYATANYVSEGGKPLEGLGVKPDEEVRPDRKLLLEGRDAVREAAVRWIGKQKKGM